MCCRKFVKLANSSYLDKIMFRCGHGTATRKPRMHSVLGRLLWTNCPCRDRLLLRPPNDGCPAGKWSYECRRHSQGRNSEEIPSMAKDSLTVPLGESEGLIALESPVMQEYFAYPSLNRVSVYPFGPPIDARQISHLHRDTGITVGDVIRAILQQAATRYSGTACYLETFPGFRMEFRLSARLPGTWRDADTWALLAFRESLPLCRKRKHL